MSRYSLVFAFILPALVAHCGDDSSVVDEAGKGGLHGEGGSKAPSAGAGGIGAHAGQGGSRSAGGAGESGASTDAGRSSSAAGGGADAGGDSSTGDVGHSGAAASEAGAGGSGGGAGPAAMGHVQAIGVGYSYACALADGDVYCWGGNSSGALGDGSNVNSSVPVRVKDLHDVSAIAVGFSHSCALAQGEVWCWGLNEHGQLGDGTKMKSSRPVRVNGLEGDVTAITAGAGHTCAIVAGVAYCWGGNVTGQLGDNTSSDRLSPALIAGLTHVTSLSAAEYQTCAVNSGDVWCWGQLGPAGFSLVPKKVDGIRGVSVVSAGGDFACAIVDGAPSCWGDNTYGQLGRGNVESSSVPVPVVGLDTGTSAISSGSVEACAVSNGAAYCWGYNIEGGVGDLSTQMRTAPQLVWGLGSGVTDVSSGVFGACALKRGRAYCWGHGTGSVIPTLMGGDGDLSVPSRCENGPSLPDPGVNQVVDPAECSGPRTRTWAQWPMPNASCQGLPNPRTLTVSTVSGGDVVVDHVTGLMWERETPVGSTGWQAARKRCEDLTLGGYCDWRLPSRVELLSVLDLRRGSAPYELAPFTNFRQDGYWASSELDAEYAYCVSFSGGWTGRRQKVGDALTGRCVRGGPPAPSSPGAAHYQREGGAVRDLGTHLLWQATPARTAMTFRDALDYCAAAGTGLRLPSAVELQTLVDETRSAPAVDITAFPDVVSEPYWSSTSVGTLAWSVDFRNGLSDTTSVDALLRVICVR